uniref:Maturase K n=1 Tax=Heterorhabditis bacteriophora TaxID=37862 RepID=A0A1I7WFT1_HETBA
MKFKLEIFKFYQCNHREQKKKQETVCYHFNTHCIYRWVFQKFARINPLTWKRYSPTQIFFPLASCAFRPIRQNSLSGMHRPEGQRTLQITYEKVSVFCYNTTLDLLYNTGCGISSDTRFKSFRYANEARCLKLLWPMFKISSKSLVFELLFNVQSPTHSHHRLRRMLRLRRSSSGSSSDPWYIKGSGKPRSVNISDYRIGHSNRTGHLLMRPKQLLSCV